MQRAQRKLFHPMPHSNNANDSSYGVHSSHQHSSAMTGHGGGGHPHSSYGDMIGEGPPRDMCAGCKRLGLTLFGCDDAGESATQRYCAQCMIGKHVRVFWPVDEQWYVGVVERFDPTTGEHLLTYPDGDTEWVKVGENGNGLSSGGGSTTLSAPGEQPQQIGRSRSGNMSGSEQQPQQHHHLSRPPSEPPYPGMSSYPPPYGHEQSGRHSGMSHGPDGRGAMPPQERVDSPDRPPPPQSAAPYDPMGLQGPPGGWPPQPSRKEGQPAAPPRSAVPPPYGYPPIGYGPHPGMPPGSYGPYGGPAYPHGSYGYAPPPAMPMMGAPPPGAKRTSNGPEGAQGSNSQMLSSSGSKRKSGPKTWTKEEDSVLLNMVQGMRMPMKWSIVAQSMPERTGKQCRERYVNHLNPRLKSADWAPSEDAVIFHLYNTTGSQWAKMSKMIPGRTDNGIKNRFHNLRRQLEREDEHRVRLSKPQDFPDEIRLERLRSFPSNLRGKSDELWDMSDGIGVLAAQSVLGNSFARNVGRFGPFKEADPAGEQCARCGLFAPSVQCGNEICSRTKWCQACTRIPPHMSSNLLRECLNLRRCQDLEKAKVIEGWDEEKKDDSTEQKDSSK